MPVYATIDDYIQYTGVPISPPYMPEDLLIPAGSAGPMGPTEVPPRVFIRASLAIDKALVGAIYTTDVDGLPTDAALLEVFKDATCAQARHMVECFVNPPVPGQPKPVPYMEHLSTEAFDILRGAGLIPITLRMLG
jgi:hypothetical protein